MFSASQVRARAAKSATDSVVSVESAVSVMPRPPAVRLPAQRVHRAVVVLGRAEHGAVQGDPAQVQVQVVLPGHADPAVQLHAILQHHRGAFGHIGFRDADQHVGVGETRSATAATAPRRGRPARLEPHLHVGGPVLERLIGRQRPTEAVPVEQPLGGEVRARRPGSRRVRRTAGPARPDAGARSRRPSVRRCPTAADSCDLDAVELHSGVTLHHVDGLLRGDGDAGGVGGHQELRGSRRRSRRPPAARRSRRPPRPGP